MPTGHPDSEALLPRIVRFRLGHAVGTAQAIEAPATLLLVDLAGSTALAHALALEGRAGVDRLNDRMNGSLGRLADAVVAHGGDVLRFLGDALLVAWWGAPSESAVQAAHCALMLQPMLDEAGVGTADWQPRVRIVVTTGVVDVVALGGERARWEVAYGGAAVRASWSLLPSAPIGEVYVASETWPLLAGCAQGTEQGPGVVLHLLDRAPAPPERSPPNEAPWASTSAFLPNALRYRLGAEDVPRVAGARPSARAWSSELRKITAVFVRIADPPPGADMWRQRAIVGLQRMVYRHEGALEKLFFDAEGLVALVVYGLPPLSHTDDARRAIRAGLDLRDLAVDGVRVVRAVGIATGEVFCGLVGGERRREYSMIGDAVNVAARLIPAGEAELHIRCDAATIAAAGRGVMSSAPLPTRMKGKTELVDISLVLAERPPPRHLAMPLFGRVEELASLARVRRRVVAEKAWRIVVVSGEPGLGKTHLTETFLAQESERGMRVAIARCESFTQAVGHRPWRHLLGTLAAGDPAATRVLQALFHDSLENSRLRAAPSAEPEPIGRARADRIASTLIEVLTNVIGDQPTILAIEDAQWMDSASWSIVARLAGTSLPVMLILTTPSPDLPKGLDAQVLTLSPLAADELNLLVGESLGALPPPALEEVLRLHADGNPLFAQAIAWSMHDRGELLIEDGQARLTSGRSATVPDTIKDVFVARIDRLAPRLALTVRVASVLGRSFTRDALVAIHPVGPPEDADFATLIALDFIEEHAPGEYSFNHAFAHSAVYETLIASQRVPLHAAAAEWYERQATRTEDALLGRHWAGAESPKKAARHLGRAGVRAVEAGAFAEAVGLLEEAIAWDTSADTPDPERATWERALGEAHYGRARLVDARRSLESALRRRGRRVPAGAFGFVLAAAWVSLIQLVHLARPPAQREAEKASTEVSLAAERLAQVYFLENLTFPALWATLTGLNLAERGRPTAELARAYANMGIAAGGMGWDGLAHRYLACADGVVDAIRSPATEAYVATNRGILHYGKARLDVAVPELRRGRDLANAAGASRQSAEVTVNLAGLLDRLGQCREAWGIWTDMLATATRQGNLQVEVWALCGMVTEELLATGDSATAEDLQVATFVGAGSLAGVDFLWAEGLLLKLHLARGDHDAARGAGARLVARLPSRRGLGHYTLDAYEALAELSISDFRRGLGSTGHVKRAVAALERYAGTLALGWPAAWRYRGWLAILLGDPAQALECWAKGCDIAEGMGTWPNVVYMAEDALAHGGGEAWGVRAADARARLEFPDILVPVVGGAARAFARGA